jgi:hypothetical protein
LKHNLDFDRNTERIRNRNKIGHQQAVEVRTDSPTESLTEHQHWLWYWLQIGTMLEYFKWHLCSIKWLLGGRIRYLALPLAYGVSTVASVISTIVVSENFHPWFSRNMKVDNLLLMALSALVIFPMLFAPAVFLHFIIM